MDTTNVTPTSNHENEIKWTPALIMQAFKEGVTALLGVTLVVATVLLAWRNYGLISTPLENADAEMVAQKVAWAKDILIIIVGLSGVVLGYYFGRVPADAHAAQAQTTADLATSHAQEVSAQAEAVANQVEEVIAAAAPPPAEDGARAAADIRTIELTGELQKLHEQLRNLARVARK